MRPGTQPVASDYKDTALWDCTAPKSASWKRIACAESQRPRRQRGPTSHSRKGATRIQREGICKVAGLPEIEREASANSGRLGWESGQHSQTRGWDKKAHRRPWEAGKRVYLESREAEYPSRWDPLHLLPVGEGGQDKVEGADSWAAAEGTRAEGRRHQQDTEELQQSRQCEHSQC